MAAHSAKHSYRLSGGRRPFRRYRVLAGVNAQSLPFFSGKKNGARIVGTFPAQHGEVKDAPGDDHINADAGLKAGSGIQVAVLNQTTTFHGAVIDLNTPAASVPLHALSCIGEAADLDRGEQHPFNGGAAGRVLALFT